MTSTHEDDIELESFCIVYKYGRLSVLGALRAPVVILITLLKV